MHLDRLPFFEKLDSAQRILIAGAGGGFDVFAGLPLVFALEKLGKQVHLANLTFTYLGGTNAELLLPNLRRVLATSRGEDAYFPERYLAEWFAGRGQARPIYCFEKTGVAPLRAAYSQLVRDLEIDAVILVDGGTDILMRGDEAGLGTPEEDMTSLAAVAGLPVAHKFVSCLGFGIDAFHGVCHAQFLENVAALDAQGGFLGAHSVLMQMEEGRLFAEAIEFAHARMPARQSIVNGSILSALEGRFGDYHRTARTRGSKLFINPLMTQYWHFDLEALAKQSLYLDRLAETQTIWDVSLVIERFRGEVKARLRSVIPV